MIGLAYDDQPEDYLERLQGYFEQYFGIALTVVDQPKDFLTKLHTAPWDFVMTDLVYKDQDTGHEEVVGIDIAHSTRRLMPKIPIILLTAYNDVAVREQGNMTNITHPRLFFSKEVLPHWMAHDIYDFLQLVQEKVSTPKAEHVFIGHGRSGEWRKLRQLLKDDFDLEIEEFDNTPAAGYSVKERLQSMMDNAKFAFIILTAEDEQADETYRARQNVIHEVGLFQGRLGFENAIVLLEDGCEKFTNNDGIVHMAFPPGQLENTFYNIQKLLKQRGVI